MKYYDITTYKPYMYVCIYVYIYIYIYIYSILLVYSRRRPASLSATQSVMTTVI